MEVTSPLPEETAASYPHWRPETIGATLEPAPPALLSSSSRIWEVECSTWLIQSLWAVQRQSLKFIFFFWGKKIICGPSRIF